MAPLLLALAVAVGVTFAGCCITYWLKHRKVRFGAAGMAMRVAKPANLIRPSSLANVQRLAPVPGRPTEIARVPGLTMREAEDLLDWLEHNGYSERELKCEQDRFTVEFRVDAGHVQPGPHQIGQSTPRTSAS